MPPAETAVIDRIAASIRVGWKPGRCCRLPARTAWYRVVRIKALVSRGMLEPGRAVRAARAAEWEATHGE